MTPETYIRAAISNLWVDKFPEGDTTAYPKGLIKRISSPMIQEKDRTSDRQYNIRIRILWYDTKMTDFDTKRDAIITAMYGIESESDIKRVMYEDTDYGWDPITDKHVMNVEFIVKCIKS